MVQLENLENELVRHYSDGGYKIRQIETGIVYSEAVDVVPCRYTYEETDELIEQRTAIESERIKEEAAKQVAKPATTALSYEDL